MLENCTMDTPALGARSHAKTSAAPEPIPTNGNEFRLPGIDGRTKPARAFRQLMLDLVSDSGGAEHCSAVRRQLIARFAGACVLAQEIERRVALGERVDIGEYAVLAGVANRLGQRLGLSRRMKEVVEPDPFAGFKLAGEE
jgi:hypothetical protein